MNIEIKNNLTSIGKEIISSNTNTNKNKKILTLESPKENNIKKEIKDELDIKTIKPYNSINSFRNSNISTLTDTKKITTYYNLSKLNYKDGYILKDATNSNPGFGLWSIKLPQSNKNTIEKKEEKIINKKYYINNNNKLNIEIKEISDSEENDINLFDSIENNYEEDQTDKIMINRLTKRNKKLEKKYNNLLINYYEKENQYLSLERARKEYEKLINASIKEKNEAEYNLNILDNTNQALIVSISNARKEIERLISVIKETQINMKQELDEYNNILIKEEQKRKKIINAIKAEEKQINIIQDKINENEGNTLGDNINNKKEKEKNKEKEIKTNKKKEYIKKLQQELERLYIIDKEKQEEKNNLFKKINEINNDKKKNIKIREDIIKKIENQQRDKQWNEQAIKIRNNIIYNLKRNSNSK